MTEAKIKMLTICRLKAANIKRQEPTHPKVLPPGRLPPHKSPGEHTAGHLAALFTCYQAGKDPRSQLWVPGFPAEGARIYFPGKHESLWNTCLFSVVLVLGWLLSPLHPPVHSYWSHLFLHFKFHCFLPPCRSLTRRFCLASSHVTTTTPF